MTEKLAYDLSLEFQYLNDCSKYNEMISRYQKEMMPLRNPNNHILSCIQNITDEMDFRSKQFAIIRTCCYIEQRYKDRHPIKN